MTKWPYNKYKQLVTWWKKSGQDNFGSSTYDTPICFEGRWEKKQELFIDKMGEERKSSAVVWTPCNTFEGDYLYLGESNNINPLELAGAREIRRIKRKSGWKENEWTEIRAFL